MICLTVDLPSGRQLRFRIDAPSTTEHTSVTASSGHGPRRPLRLVVAPRMPRQPRVGFRGTTS